MKNIRLLFIVATLYACTPNAVNTLPGSKTVTISPINPTISPSILSSSITPSITVTSPSPLQTSSASSYKIDSIGIYSDTGIIMSELRQISHQDYENKNYIYNALKHESLKFSLESIDRIYNLNNNVTWSVSDDNLASINQNGLLTTKENVGSFSVIATLKNYPTEKLSFQVNILEDSEYLECHNKLPEKSERFVKLPGFGYGEDKELVSLIGKVYDLNGMPIEGVKVNAQSIDPGVNWFGDTQTTTTNGAYVFSNVPVGLRISIKATKYDRTSRTREAISKSYFSDSLCANVYDFYKTSAIQDEPEITQLKINGKIVNGSSRNDIFNNGYPKNLKPTSTQLSNNLEIDNIGNLPILTGVDSKTLEVEMTFSEPVRDDDIKKYFRITSPSEFNNKNSNFIIDGNYSGVDFTVSSDEKIITFKTNKSILANKEGQEARYMIDFSQPFRDKTDKSAIDRRHFRLSDTQINDFAVFSVKNDEEAPKLLGITARDGINGANDTIELRYSESMELINQVSYPSGLADPNAPSNLSRQLWYRDANNVKADDTAITNSTIDNNATIIGYLSNSDTDINQFKASYMIGRTLSKDVTNGTPKLSILGSINRTPNTTPVKGNTVANDLLRNVRITGSNVLLEFSPTAFDRDDRVLVTVAGRAHGSYVDRNRTPSVREELTVNTAGNTVEYAPIYDPAGRLIDTGNSTTSVNIDVDNGQRVATAS